MLSHIRVARREKQMSCGAILVCRIMRQETTDDMR